MCVSEITTARLNGANVPCHFGLNNLFADNGLEDDHLPTRLYFPADGGQMKACVEAVFHDPGLRFVFSTRSKVPDILDPEGFPLHGDGYLFKPGRDEVVREGEAGTIVSYGDSLHRALDVVEKLRLEGIGVRLTNKASLNVVDETMMETIGHSPFVLVVESLNRRTGLGSRFGTWLLERGYHPRYAHLGTWREGCGGLWEQAPHRGIDSDGILSHVRALLA
jgi:transketolase C-terminal domain/subunit